MLSFVITPVKETQTVQTSQIISCTTEETHTDETPGDLTPARITFCVATVKLHAVKCRIFRAMHREGLLGKQKLSRVHDSKVLFPNPHTYYPPPPPIPLYMLCALTQKQEPYHHCVTRLTVQRSMEGRWGCGFFFFCISTLVMLPGLKVGMKSLGFKWWICEMNAWSGALLVLQWDIICIFLLGRLVCKCCTCIILLLISQSDIIWMHSECTWTGNVSSADRRFSNM